MKYLLLVLTAFSGIFSVTSAHAGVMIGSYEFDLGQFSVATVTYRTPASGGQVTFDGKLWDNDVGVSGYTTGELAAGQFGSDPGDQLSLNNRTTPDWFQLNYGGGGITIGGPANDTFVLYEITSSSSGVDTEGTSWKISFNGGALIDASSGTATFLSFPGSENVNQIAFNLTDFGLASGDKLQTVYVENINSGSGTSDPDFIFTALEGTALDVVPEPSGIAIWTCIAIGCAGFGRRRQS